MLKIKDLRVEVEDKEVLKGLNLEVKEGEIHAIMGPNGAGKSTLGLVIAGHPKYKVIEGQILFKGKNILEMEADERAKLGIFLAFQNPVEVEGLRLWKLLWESYKAQGKEKKNVREFLEEVKGYAKEVGLSKEHLNRALNVGFSGGEKKRGEMLQLLTLNPDLTILDEIDSGLDIDSLKIVAEIVKRKNKEGKAFMIITHYTKLLKYVKPHKVHILMNGKIVKEGSNELLEILDEKGYKGLVENGE